MAGTISTDVWCHRLGNPIHDYFSPLWWVSNIPSFIILCAQIAIENIEIGRIRNVTSPLCYNLMPCMACGPTLSLTISTLIISPFPRTSPTISNSSLSFANSFMKYGPNTEQWSIILSSSITFKHVNLTILE